MNNDITIRNIIGQLRGVELSDSQTRRVSDFSVLTKNNDYLSKENLHLDIKEIIGSIDYNHFENNLFFWYEQQTLIGDYNSFKDKIRRDCEYNRGKIQNLLDSLWFVKDCAININAFYQIDLNKEIILSRKISKDFFYTNSKGNHEIISLDESEFNSALLFCNILTKFKSKRSSIPITELIENNITDDYLTDLKYDLPINKNNYIERALFYLHYARKDDHLPFKIAFFIMIFETLFSVSRDNITNNLCLAVSNFVGGTAEDNKINKLLVREGYSVRSDLFHGSYVRKPSKKSILTKEEIIDLSINIDKLARVVLTKILAHHQNEYTTKEKRKKFILDLLY